ncbi:MAG: helix-turn-helix domain-containing protein [Ruminococcus bicirculans (ex Wegman et al. 2014)]|uniref:helix-turn-helix domain-containing protein n=1 Tax=Ruminococcus bicirculans (ex Wegman et al. 2014) TaxID=1160721 RepID=UPI0039A1F76A
MNIIAQEAHFRQRVVKYSNKKGVTEASRRYHVSRQAIYEWRARYDGTWKSLKEKVTVHIIIQMNIQQRKKK